MIVKMKRVTVLVPENKAASCVEELKKLGILHVKNIIPPESEEITKIEELIARGKKVQDILEPYRAGTKATVTWLHSEFESEINGIIFSCSEKEDILRQLKELDNEKEYFNAWGAFDPRDIKLLSKSGVAVKLYRVPKVAEKKLAGLENIYRISETKEHIFIAYIAYKAEDALTFEEIDLPKESASALLAKYEHLQKSLAGIEAVLKEKAIMAGDIDKQMAILEAKLSSLKAMYGMGKEKGFLYIQGFCPEQETDRVETLAKQSSYGYFIERSFDDDQTPTLIKNPKFISIINPVFKFMNTVPGYKEYDASLWFLIFFSLFFAMLIGDAGYGTLYLIVTIWAARKFKSVPREPFYLLMLLSVATIIWGSISGTWFGVEKISKLPFFNAFVIDKFYNFSAVSNRDFMMKLCFTIGAVHLTGAHLLIITRMINSWKALADVGWIMIVWSLYFLANTLILNETYPVYAGYALTAGTLLILVFAHFQKNILKGILTTIIDLPLKIISGFSDVVSYIRLFAVGYASFIVAVSFNDMALGSGLNNFVATLGAAVILFFGHALNIALGLMAVIVHGLRLNMLEFSGHLGMEWSGKEYKPLSE